MKTNLKKEILEEFREFTKHSQFINYKKIEVFIEKALDRMEEESKIKQRYILDQIKDWTNGRDVTKETLRTLLNTIKDVEGIRIDPKTRKFINSLQKEK